MEVLIWVSGAAGFKCNATKWLGEQGISAFGVEMMSPGIQVFPNKEVHQFGGALRFTHYGKYDAIYNLLIWSRSI